MYAVCFRNTLYEVTIYTWLQAISGGKTWMEKNPSRKKYPLDSLKDPLAAAAGNFSSQKIFIWEDEGEEGAREFTTMIHRINAFSFILKVAET